MLYLLTLSEAINLFNLFKTKQVLIYITVTILNTKKCIIKPYIVGRFQSDTYSVWFMLENYRSVIDLNVFMKLFLFSVDISLVFRNELYKFQCKSLASVERKCIIDIIICLHIYFACRILSINIFYQYQALRKVHLEIWNIRQSKS